MRAATIQSAAPQRSMGGSPHRGFTLVELLVVIGIITLLIGILFPVLGRAREYARTIQCASNIKQICNAVLMYVNDNRGILPFTSALPESMLSPETLRAYPVRLQEFGRLNFNEGTFWPYLSASPAVREQIYSCPSDEPPRYARQYLLPKPNLNFPRNFSYTFHGDIGGWARKIPPQSFKDWAGLKITMVKHPSHKVMILEEEMPRQAGGSPVAPHGSNDYGDPEAPPVVILLTRRHMRKANEGFFDGHVELFDPDVLRGDAPDLEPIDAYHVYFKLFEES